MKYLFGLIANTIDVVTIKNRVNSLWMLFATTEGKVMSVKPISIHSEAFTAMVGYQSIGRFEP